MKTILALMAVYLSTLTSVLACSCFSPVNRETVVNAKSIYVFRVAKLESAILASDGPVIVEPARGTYVVLQVLRGNPPVSTRFQFYSGECCGSRFEIDGNYVAFLDESEGDFVAGAHNVLYLGSTFSGLDEQLTQAIQHVAPPDANFEKAFDFVDLHRLDIRRLPSALPIPCPPVRKK
jgi:hypothetical protein